MKTYLIVEPGRFYCGEYSRRDMLKLDDDRRIYLIQRMKERKFDDSRRGVAKFFAFDYMGSTEFEWGAVPKAISAMREYKEFRAYYLGPSKWLPVIREFFRRELEDEYHTPLKESTYIASAYGVGRFDTIAEGIIGWLDIDNHW